jgi:hypothetical protein
MLMQSHTGNEGATQQITWTYKFMFDLLIGSCATNSVVGVHWFPLARLEFCHCVNFIKDFSILTIVSMIVLG